MRESDGSRDEEEGGVRIRCALQKEGLCDQCQQLTRLRAGLMKTHHANQCLHAQQIVVSESQLGLYSHGILEV